MGKKLLVLGAGSFQATAIAKARQLGYTVISVSNNIHEPGHKISDKAIDCSTIDKETVLNHAQEENIDGIITIASEVAAPTVAYVAEKMGLPGYSYKAAQNISNKYLLRKFFTKNGIPGPAFAHAKSLKEAKKAFATLKTPVFMKPVAASGSRGTFKIHTVEELEKHFHESLSSSILDKQVIIEEELTGLEIGGEALIANGEMIFFQPTIKYLNVAFVPEGHSLPADISPTQFSESKSLINQAAKALKLKNGPLNFDIMLTVNGPVIIELGGRLGGNCLPELMELHTGISTADAVIKLAMNEQIDLPGPQSNYVGAAIIGSKKEGVIKKIHSFESLLPKWKTDLISTSFQKNAGDKIFTFTQGNYQAGYFIFKADSLEGLGLKMKKILEQNWIEV